MTLLTSAISRASEIPHAVAYPLAVEHSVAGKAARAQKTTEAMDVVKWVGALGAAILLVRTLRR
ncbi:MAG TPA: hypothetical protein VLO11_06190 [Luteolibacter sp.]|nr:hypothetical protein [Luteolibacter sp.]